MITTTSWLLTSEIQCWEQFRNYIEDQWDRLPWWAGNVCYGFRIRNWEYVMCGLQVWLLAILQCLYVHFSSSWFWNGLVTCLTNTIWKWFGTFKAKPWKRLAVFASWLWETRCHLRSLTNLRPLCCKEAQASHLEGHWGVSHVIEALLDHQAHWMQLNDFRWHYVELKSQSVEPWSNSCPTESSKITTHCCFQPLGVGIVY